MGSVGSAGRGARLTVPMPSELLKTMMCALVCTAACIGIMLVIVLASLLATSEEKGHVFGLYLHVSLFHTYRTLT